MKRLTTLAVVLCAMATALGDGVRLRGYGGKVEATFGKDDVAFACENEAVAKRLYAKLLRDLDGISAVAPKHAGGSFVFASGRRAKVGLKGNTVVVAEGESPLGEGVEQPVPEAYPPYLDYFDLRALKFYKRPMDSFLGFGVESHWPFAEKVGIGGYVSHGIDIAGTRGPGVYSYLPWDFGVDAAAKAGSMLTLSPTFAGQMPLWMFNAFPEKCAKPQRHTLVTEWIQGVEGMPFDGDGPGFPDDCSPTLAFEKATIERYVDNPGLGGWQFYCGKPIGDQLGRAMDGCLWDASEEGLAAQKEWLRKKYTLRDLSVRWTGNPHAYRQWKDVPDMQLIDLIGGGWDKDRLDLFSLPWQWAKAPEKTTWVGHEAGWVTDPAVETGVPPPEGTKWLSVDMPPSHRCNYVESGRCWYRLVLPKSDWLAANRTRDLYLRLILYLPDGQKFVSWINGRRFDANCAGSCNMSGARIERGTFRNDGTDEIVVEMPSGRSCGRLTGPVSLSPCPPENFPYKNPRTNARYLDNVCFQNAKIVERNLKVFLAGRALDKNRPISISGADTPILSEMAPVFGEQGFAMQSTSTDGFYWPNLPDMGRQHGFYFIGEPSADISAEDRFDRNFGTIFYTGASSTAIFMDIEQYMRFEQETGGMTARKPVMRLVGKYLVDEPKIALLNSTLTSLLSTGTEYMWNLLRGELQGIHYDAAMTTEKALFRGLVTPEKYPILVDCGADVMDEDTVAAIERYVAAGGTFVAFTETGRHTPYVRDAHPFARVSGFRTHDFEGGNTEVAFGARETPFPLWAGKSFAANGYGRFTQSNWQWNRMLDRVAEDAEVVATWKPSGKPAVGFRKLGKGRVITIASGFWREARDLRGKWMQSQYNRLADELFAQLGARRVTDASSFNVWTRKATSKDGFEDWLIAFNIALDDKLAPVPQKTTLAFRTAACPVRVVDAFTREDVPGWTYEGGFVRIPECEIGPFKTRILAAVRPIPVAEALKTWWGEKVKYWKAGPELTFPKSKPMDAKGMALFDRWEFSADGGKSWREAKPQTWKLQFPDLKDYAGEAVYRTRFAVPSDKKGRPFSIRYGVKTLYDKAELFLNGRKFRDFDQAKVHRELCGIQATEVSGLLNFGAENTLEVHVHGGKLFTAGICDIIWMEEEPVLKDAVSLNGDWEKVMRDFHTCGPATIPGKTFCRFLRRKVELPASWSGKDVYFRFVSPENTVSSVVVNGIGRNIGGLSPFANREFINVTELVKPGQTNEIELWHRRTVPVDWKGKAWGWAPEDTMEISDVALGIVE